MVRRWSVLEACKRIQGCQRNALCTLPWSKSVASCVQEVGNISVASSSYVVHCSRCMVVGRSLGMGFLSEMTAC